MPAEATVATGVLGSDREESTVAILVDRWSIEVDAAVVPTLLSPTKVNLEPEVIRGARFGREA